MPSEELRRRLEALNRKPLENLPNEKTRPAAKARQKRPAPLRPPMSARNDVKVRVAEGELENRSALSGAPLEVCLPGEIRTAPGGLLYYHIQRRLADHAPWSLTLGAELGEALEGEPLRTRLRRTTGIPPERVLFLDLETLGLRGSEPLFLIGALRIEASDAVTCHQLLARAPSEEPAAVAAFAEMLHAARLLVTFNGKAFDMPLLRDRAAFHGIPLPDAPLHLDMLVEARRRFRRQVPDCRLQTLEQRICGRTRTGDIPGREIPRAYHDFLRTGDAARLTLVVQHNLLDLATTADLLAHLWR